MTSHPTPVTLLSIDFTEHTEHTLRCLGCEQEFEIRVPRLVSALHTFATWINYVDGLCPKCWRARKSEGGRREPKS